MTEAVIVDCLRTPVGKSGRGGLRNTRPDDLAAIVIRALMEKYPQVAPDEIDDLILGCAMPEGEQGMNVARIAALRAGLPDMVPGVTINRFCSSGLQSIAMAADRIRAGGAGIILAAAAADGLPATGLVYAGMSMGCGYATWLALDHRPGSARAMLYLFGSVDPAWFEVTWPEGLPAVAHQTLDDPWREAEADDGFRARVPGGQLVDYPGSGHLFLDDSTDDHDPAAAARATAHVLAWLAALD